ncbi:hypothetical protein V6Z11_A11G224900 [Gossypium hirsutum]
MLKATVFQTYYCQSQNLLVKTKQQLISSLFPRLHHVPHLYIPNFDCNS